MKNENVESLKEIEEVEERDSGPTIDVIYA